MSDYSALLFVNFKELEQANKSTRSTLVTSVIGGLQYNSLRNLYLYSKASLEALFQLSYGRIKTILNGLENGGFIGRSIKQIQGISRILIDIKSSIKLKMDALKLKVVTLFTGNILSSYVLSHIAFRLNVNNKHAVTYEGRLWSTFSKSYLAKVLNIKERTVCILLRRLELLGLIHRQRLNQDDKRKMYYTIDADKYAEIVKELERQVFVGEKQFSDRTHPPTIYNNNTRDIKHNNITEKVNSGVAHLSAAPSSDIILNKRQEKYLRSAVLRTKERVKALWDFEEIHAWCYYSITNTSQHKEITSFKHKVNRIMKLLTEGKFNRPFGFDKYTEMGRHLAMHTQQQIAEIATSSQSTMGKLLTGAKDFFKPTGTARSSTTVVKDDAWVDARKRELERQYLQLKAQKEAEQC